MFCIPLLDFTTALLHFTSDFQESKKYTVSLEKTIQNLQKLKTNNKPTALKKIITLKKKSYGKLPIYLCSWIQFLEHPESKTFYEDMKSFENSVSEDEYVDDPPSEQE